MEMHIIHGQTTKDLVYALRTGSFLMCKLVE